MGTGRSCVMPRKCLAAVAALAAVIKAMWYFPQAAAATEICLYQAADGAMRQVNARSAIPPEFRAKAKCFVPGKARHEHLAKPEDMQLKGNLRAEQMVSPLGNIELRWPRKIEKLFGRTPERAMADAAATVSRALKKGGFPYEAQTLNLSWQVVFLDENLPEAQIPAALVNNCHPGWMTPPANIYIASQRVAAGCGRSSPVNSGVADAQLARVLIHEMGHALEYVLLGQVQRFDRMRAEGFASWFEQYAADSSNVIPRGAVKNEYAKLARSSLKAAPDYFEFSGSPEDYARAALYFQVIVERKGVNGLMKVYEAMKRDKSDLLSAIQRAHMWSEPQIAKEIRKIAERR